MDYKYTEDEARDQIKAWGDLCDRELSEDDIGDFLRPVRQGRITLENMVFTYRLHHPLTLANGDTVETIKAREMTAGELRGKDTDGMSLTLRLISKASDLPLGVVLRMVTRDLRIAGGLLGFFI